MAPPANRRSGFSRRAQYTIFISYFAGVAGVLLGVVLLVVSFVQPSAFVGMRALASDVTEPAGQVTATGRMASKNVFATVAGFIKAGSQHAKLERELALAKTRLVEARAMSVENRRLKGLLGLARQNPPPVVVTRLTSSTAASTRRFATLAAGIDRGVQKGMPVRSELGLLGRVLEVGQSSARVLLVTDTESLVPVRRASDGVPAFAQGTGDGTIRIKLISLGLNPLKKGDVFVTSGSGGLYRPGTPIAIAARINSDGAIAQVLANPSDADYVLVDQPFAPVPPPPVAPIPDSQ
ncbi:rod shape-determining protein MreC [Novosphingobium chloroacetimidivorans]|uniref:Cell shape-determining protein MreC n=1 Tax=Novosphingobium chloroacetimidivorans TaxID=1428314 RepID=A0A7W7NUY2_9SPHN|nr:rod shape-determining protein MreC [Novosphingobium chloroacetimidivorans]MBB4856714.1 rod shape-determining protein MreC [Novosphingobium chloroacetimidivorans]